MQEDLFYPNTVYNEFRITLFLYLIKKVPIFWGMSEDDKLLWGVGLAVARVKQC